MDFVQVLGSPVHEVTGSKIEVDRVFRVTLVLHDDGRRINGAVEAVYLRGLNNEGILSDEPPFATITSDGGATGIGPCA
jgi:hypothetical protein